MNRQFETPEPIELYVEICKGKVEITAGSTTTTTLDIEGRDADEVEVTFENNRLTVIGPKESGNWFGGGNRDLHVEVELPTASDLGVKTGSADIEIEGQVNEVRVKTGSGDVEIAEAMAELRVKSGSGDMSIGNCLGNLNVSTGSGDVEVGTTSAKAVVKTGSGDLKVVTANSDISMSTGSGDMAIGTVRRGHVSLKGASSDLNIGIPAGTPVWADINTVTGSIRSSIESVGAPQEGQEHVELQARTVSGDITLTEV
jgi:DUF4097 and DUF4098 domain-containing protein YvlB